MAQFVLGVALVDPVAELVVLGVEGGVKLLAGCVALLSDKVANLTGMHEHYINLLQVED